MAFERRYAFLDPLHVQFPLMTETFESIRRKVVKRKINIKSKKHGKSLWENARCWVDLHFAEHVPFNKSLTVKVFNSGMRTLTATQYKIIFGLYGVCISFSLSLFFSFKFIHILMKSLYFWRSSVGRLNSIAMNRKSKPKKYIILFHFIFASSFGKFEHFVRNSHWHKLLGKVLCDRCKLCAK